MSWHMILFTFVCSGNNCYDLKIKTGILLWPVLIAIVYISLQKSQWCQLAPGSHWHSPISSTPDCHMQVGLRLPLQPLPIRTAPSALSAASYCQQPPSALCQQLSHVVSSLILLATIISLVPWSSWLLTVVSKFVQLPTHQYCIATLSMHFSHLSCPHLHRPPH